MAETTITLEFTPDGKCSVAVRASGAPASSGSADRGGHAELSYQPLTPGRCAVPALRQRGPVSLTVLLPPGAERPRASTPKLTWTFREGRVIGTATLATPPEYVDIMPPNEGLSPIYGWVLLAVAVLALVWAFARSRGARR